MRFTDGTSAVRAPPISEPTPWSPEWMEGHAAADSPAYKKMHAIVAELARRDGIEVDDATMARMMLEHEKMEQMHTHMKACTLESPPGESQLSGHSSLSK